MSEFFNKKIRERVGTVFLAAEGAGTLGLRIKAAKMAANITHPLPIAIISDVPNLSDRTLIMPLVEDLRVIEAKFRAKFGVRLGLIVIDTVAAAFVMADENSNAEAAAIIRHLSQIAKATGALVMPVHHHGKTLGTGLRGASAFKAGADAIVGVMAERNELTGDVASRSLVLSKSRTGHEGPISGFDVINMTLGDDDYGDPFGAGYAVPNDCPVSRAEARRDPASLMIFRSAFDAVRERAGILKPESVDANALSAVPYREVHAQFMRSYTLPTGGKIKSIAAAQRAFTRRMAELPPEFREVVDPEGRRWIVLTR